MKKKKCGYFWRVNRTLKKMFPRGYMTYTDFRKLTPRKRAYVIKHWFEFKWLFIALFLCVNCFAFQGVGDCQKLLQDYAQLTNKSVFLPHLLDGNCVVQSEKHFPLIMKNAGFNYSEKSGYIQIKPIVYKEREQVKEEWKPQSKYYDVEFTFLNLSSAIDCGLTMDEILANLHNLDYTFSLGLNLGCPALDYDGSFAFKVNAHLIDSWSYSHGIESQRQRAQITSSTGAVTNEYDYITTGLNLTLYQSEKGVFFSLKYTGNNGSVTTASGGVVDEIKATTTDEFTRVRKFWIIPIGKEKIRATYSLILRIRSSDLPPKEKKYT